MTRDEILADIQAVLLDPTFTNSDLERAMDEALVQAAAVVRVPELATSDTVTTVLDKGHVDLPDEFHHDLYAVTSDVSTDKVQLVSNLKELQLYSGKTRPHYIVLAEQGRKLYYEPIPDVARTLTLYFYAKPETFEYDDEAHTWMPLHLHWPVIGGYVLQQLLPKLEDGVSDAKENTQYYRAIYTEGLGLLRAEFENAPKATPHRRRSARFF